MDANLYWLCQFCLYQALVKNGFVGTDCWWDVYLYEMGEQYIVKGRGVSPLNINKWTKPLISC